MGNEDLPADDAALEGVDTPVIDEGVETVEHVTTDADPLERLASKAGWAPKEQWRGNADDWKDAAAFLEQTVDINRDLRGNIKKIERQMDTMARTSAEITRQQLERQKQEFEARFDEAVDMGDAEAARQARQGLERIKATPLPEDPAVEDFRSRNSWLGSDKDATARAVELGDLYAARGYSTSQQLEQVEKQLRYEYPQLFEQPKPKKQPPAVNTPASRVTDTRRGGTTFDDLPQAAKTQALAFEKQGVPKEEYAKSYFADLKKNGRTS